MASDRASPFDLGDPAGSVQSWAARAARQSLPELFCGLPPRALYCMPERHGLRVVALRSADLSDAQKIRVLRFRLAQYALVGFASAEVIAARGMTHEPLDSLAPGDIHVLAGSTATGEILGYSVNRVVSAARPDATLRSRDRTLLSVEEGAGWGVFNRLQTLPDLPLDRIVEGGRFVKNAMLGALDERAVRAPVEVAAALAHLLLGPLRTSVAAVLGESERHGVRRNSEFFNAAPVVLPGVVPLMGPDELLYPARMQHHFMPFALCTADIQDQGSRLQRVEAALRLPGEEAVWALLDLKHDTERPPSSFLPPGGLPALATAEVCGPQTPLEERRRLRGLGTWLTGTALFETLSEAEAPVVAALGRERRAGAGEVLSSGGAHGPVLALLRSGAVEHRARQAGRRAGGGFTIGRGEPFSVDEWPGASTEGGEVVATHDVTWLEWDADTCARYLRPLPDVRARLEQATEWLARGAPPIDSAQGTPPIPRLPQALSSP